MHAVAIRWSKHRAIGRNQIMVGRKFQRYLFTFALLALTLLVPFVSSGTVAVGAQSSAYPWSRTLRQGMSGADVVELQIRVAGWAADGPAQTYIALDGAFGPGTAAAVRRFQ